MKKTYLLLAFLLIGGSAYAAESFSKVDDNTVVASETINKVETYNIPELIQRKRATQRDIDMLKGVKAEIIRILQAAKAQGVVVNDPDVV